MPVSNQEMARQGKERDGLHLSYVVSKIHGPLKPPTFQPKGFN